MLRYGFLIVPEFTFYGLFPAIEALRVANLNSGRVLYEWQLISEDGGSVTAANGMTVAVDASIDSHAELDAVFIVIGNHPLDYCSNRLRGWLRHLDRFGVTIGAFDSGAFLLAAAGLAGEHVFALHWETIPIFRELYPVVRISEGLFNIDERRITCAGGSASLDLFLALIERDHGSELAEIVSDGFIHGQRRTGDEVQRPGFSHTVNAESEMLSMAIRIMEENIETPVFAQEIANRCGTPLRTLERLFHKGLSRPMMKVYLAKRLKLGRDYLVYSTIKVQDISLICGFSAPAVFCRAFKKNYGVSPSEFRQLHCVNRRQAIASNNRIELSGYIHSDLEFEDFSADDKIRTPSKPL